MEGVGVGGADGADDGVPGGVLLHLHDVAGPLEDGRLVHVLHLDLDGGVVPERPGGEEARVEVDVLHLHPQAVLPLPLKVQGLGGGGGGRRRSRVMEMGRER